MSHESHSDRSRREAMMEGAFTQQNRTNPTALAIVVLMHGAALTALALAKGEVIAEAITRTKIFDVKEKDPPPPEPARPIEKSATPPPRTVITHVPPIADMPREPVFVQSEPLPKAQDIVIPQ